MNIFIYEFEEVHQDALNLLSHHGIAIWTKLDKPASLDMIDVIMVRSYTRVNRDLLALYPRLKSIIRVGVGLDTIDLVECEKRGITVFHSPGANANAVAEHVLTLALMLIKHLPYQSQRLTDGLWRDTSVMGQELSALKLGLVGCGAVGSLINQKFQALGVQQVYGYDPYVSESRWLDMNCQPADWKTIWQEADIVTVQVPLTAETRRAVAEEEFNWMKPTAVMINVGRGEVVDETALINAIKTGKIAGAALDVFENEPQVNSELLSHPAIIATPHCAALTVQANRQMAVQAVERFLASLN